MHFEVFTQNILYSLKNQLTICCMAYYVTII